MLFWIVRNVCSSLGLNKMCSVVLHGLNILLASSFCSFRMFLKSDQPVLSVCTDFLWVTDVATIDNSKKKNFSLKTEGGEHHWSLLQCYHGLDLTSVREICLYNHKNKKTNVNLSNNVYSSDVFYYLLEAKGALSSEVNTFHKSSTERSNRNKKESIYFSILRLVLVFLMTQTACQRLKRSLSPKAPEVNHKTKFSSKCFA